MAWVCSGPNSDRSGKLNTCAIVPTSLGYKRPKGTCCEAQTRYQIVLVLSRASAGIPVRDAVKIAGDALDALAVKHLDHASRGVDEVFTFQTLYCLGDAGTAHPQHQGQ